MTLAIGDLPDAVVEEKLRSPTLIIVGNTVALSPWWPGLTFEVAGAKGVQALGHGWGLPDNAPHVI